MLEKDDISEFLMNFFTNRGSIKNEEPTLRNNTKTIGSGWQPSDGSKPSSVYHNNISKSCDKSDISFQKINDNERILFYSIPLRKRLNDCSYCRNKDGRISQNKIKYNLSNGIIKSKTYL